MENYQEIHDLIKEVGQLTGESKYVHDEIKELVSNLKEEKQESRERDARLESNLEYLSKILANQQKQMNKQDQLVSKNTQDIDDLKIIVKSVHSTEQKVEKLEERVGSLEKRVEDQQTENLEIKKTKISGKWSFLNIFMPALISGIISILSIVIK